MGNDCHKVLQHTTDELAKLAESMRGDTKDFVRATISALAAFKDVLHLCGSESTLSDYKN